MTAMTCCFGGSLSGLKWRHLRFTSVRGERRGCLGVGKRHLEPSSCEQSCAQASVVFTQPNTQSYTLSRFCRSLLPKAIFRCCTQAFIWKTGFGRLTLQCSTRSDSFQFPCVSASFVRRFRGRHKREQDPHRTQHQESFQRLEGHGHSLPRAPSFLLFFLSEDSIGNAPCCRRRIRTTWRRRRWPRPWTSSEAQSLARSLARIRRFTYTLNPQALNF